MSEARADRAVRRPSAPLRIALALRRFVNHPATQFAVGLILIASGVIEVSDTVLDDLQHFRVRVGHGVVIVGLVNLLASLPGVIEGIEHWLSSFDARADSEPSQDGRNGDSPENRRLT